MGGHHSNSESRQRCWKRHEDGGSRRSCSGEKSSRRNPSLGDTQRAGTLSVSQAMHHLTLTFCFLERSCQIDGRHVPYEHYSMYFLSSYPLPVHAHDSLAAVQKRPYLSLRHGH